MTGGFRLKTIDLTMHYPADIPLFCMVFVGNK
jgi:hypothetical protein